MAVKIPKSLKAISGFASKEVVRYALTGIRVQKRGEQIRVSASDGKRLVDAVLRPDGQKEFALPVETKEKESFSCLVPAKAWQEAAGTCGKNTPAFQMACVNGHVAIRSQKDDFNRMVRVPRIDEHFPDCDPVFPKDKAVLEIHFDPRLLGEALMMMADMRKSKPSVTLCFYGSDKPVLIKMRGDDADVRAVVMPVSKIDW